MTKRTNPGTDQFLVMWSRWYSALPANLAGEDPNVLIPLLRFGMPDEGVSQSDLKRKLGINQPRLSKLIKKLAKQKWIRVKRSETDGRVMRMATTVTARNLMASLELELAALLSSVSSPVVRRKRSEPQTGQQSFEMM